MEFSHGCAFVFGSESGLCCSLSEQMTLLFTFPFCKIGTRKPRTGHCVAALVCVLHGSRSSITCMEVFCVPRAVNQTDLLSSPEESGQVAFPRPLTGSTEGKIVMFA